LEPREHFDFDWLAEVALDDSWPDDEELDVGQCFIDPIRGGTFVKDVDDVLMFANARAGWARQQVRMQVNAADGDNEAREDQDHGPTAREANLAAVDSFFNEWVNDILQRTGGNQEAVDRAIRDALATATPIDDVGAADDAAISGHDVDGQTGHSDEEAIGHDGSD